jgi:hypothetical protein
MSMKSNGLSTKADALAVDKIRTVLVARTLPVAKAKQEVVWPKLV